MAASKSSVNIICRNGGFARDVDVEFDEVAKFLALKSMIETESRFIKVMDDATNV